MTSPRPWPADGGAEAAPQGLLPRVPPAAAHADASGPRELTTPSRLNSRVDATLSVRMMVSRQNLN
jgi:hypothetical protein